MQTLKKSAVVLNGFVHDFATGYWLSAMIAIHLLGTFRVEYPQLAALLGKVQVFFFWNTVGAAVVIFATGGMRTFTYVDNFYGAEAEAVRRKMLVLKHVALVAIFALGGLWAYRCAFH